MIHMIVNQQTKRAFKFNSRDEMDVAASKLPDFDNNYESYNLTVEIKDLGRVEISDPAIDDLMLGQTVGHLPDIPEAGEIEGLIADIEKGLTVIPEKHGYRFAMAAEQELNKDSEMSM